MDQGRLFCRCSGDCFLENDAARAKQNYAQALHPDGIKIDRTLLDTLDAQRLYEKSEWMGSLGVNGIRQIRCRHQPHYATKEAS